MDRRPVLVGTVLAALVGAVASGVVAAAPTSGGVTINATPNPIFTGDAVLIYGQLKTTHPGGKKIVLHERIDPAAAFTTAQTTVTDTTGFYDFTESGGVSTNRSWFVSSPAAGSAHSRTVHEVVASAVTLASSAAVGETNHPLTFTGQVTPAGVHAGESVALQKQTGKTGNNWRTIAKGVIDASSNYSISRAFLLPGAFDLRVRLTGDKQNATGSSDPLTVVVEQTENASFAIATTAPTIVIGQSTTISGRLYAQGSTTTPLAGTSVTLWGQEAGASYAPITSTKTGPDGSYSFPQTPIHNETYEVRTTFTPPARRRTAQLFEGVADQPTIGASATSSTVGATVAITGTITPDKAGHTIDLEQLGADGHYEIVKTGLVDPSSAYQFTWTFGAAGTKTFRVVVPGGIGNIKGVSPAVAITVAMPPVQSLPTS